MALRLTISHLPPHLLCYPSRHDKALTKCRGLEWADKCAALAEAIQEAEQTEGAAGANSTLQEARHLIEVATEKWSFADTYLAAIEVAKAAGSDFAAAADTLSQFCRDQGCAAATSKCVYT